MAERIGFSKVKQALFDVRFRLTLPESLQEDVNKFLNNPGCSCNGPIYRRVLQEAGDQLKMYFPTLEYVAPDVEAAELANNHWSVINCHVNELEGKLKKLPPGRKQIAVSRYGDQVTVVVNELDVIV
jgi:hypothetical protein